MIFRLTQKLSKKIGITSLPAIPFDPIRNPLLDWNAHLFTSQRNQYIILTSTASLYSIVMYVRGITNDNQFIRETLSHMQGFMTIDGNKVMFEKFIEPSANEGIYFSKMIDRRVRAGLGKLDRCISVKTAL